MKKLEDQKQSVVDDKGLKSKRDKKQSVDDKGLQSKRDKKRSVDDKGAKSQRNQKGKDSSRSSFPENKEGNVMSNGNVYSSILIRINLKMK